MRLCLIPHSFIYSLQTDDLNCGPLSVLISFGKPNSENILSITGMTDSTVVFLLLLPRSLRYTSTPAALKNVAVLRVPQHRLGVCPLNGSPLPKFLALYLHF